MTDHMPDDLSETGRDHYPQRHAANNLVYGIGKHVCPGHTQATQELVLDSVLNLPRNVGVFRFT